MEKTDRIASRRRIESLAKGAPPPRRWQRTACSKFRQNELSEAIQSGSRNSPARVPSAPPVEHPQSKRQRSAAFTKSAARSPIMMLGALVLPETSRGMMLASATHRPSMPFSFSVGSTTAASSLPIRHVPTG